MTSPIELENDLYSGLSEAVRQELSGHQEATTVGRGTPLIQKGVIPQELVILNAGTAETTVTVAGKEVSLGTAGPGRVLALHSIMTGAPPETTITSLEECRVTKVPREAFLEVLARHPEMYFAVVKVLSADLATADRLVRDSARGFQSKSAVTVRSA
jgi:CRP-like cAMP-binding protein